MPQITLILHNIRSTHNVGSIMRTAEGFGVHKIIFSGYTPYPSMPNDNRLPHISNKITGQIRKTALGAENIVPFEYYEHLDVWLRQNNDNKQIPIYALEQAKNSINIGSFIPPQEYAVILGEEVNGVDSKHLSLCDKILEIPMYGQKESFNVSVACGIMLYALTVAT